MRLACCAGKTGDAAEIVANERDATEIQLLKHIDNRRRG
jgi:hypothetical protein